MWFGFVRVCVTRAFCWVRSIALLSVKGRPLTGGEVVWPAKQGSSVPVVTASRTDTRNDCISVGCICGASKEV